jgi:uncharacterized membrane protein YgcG
LTEARAHRSRWTGTALVLGALAVAAAWVSCRRDPVPQAAIDDLPPEDPGGPSELHRPGQPCVLCHSEYEGADPALAVGGTVWQQNPTTLELGPVEGVFVTVYDSAGASQKACTNSAGNFFVRLEDWNDAKFPFTVQVGNRFMRSLIGRERSCAGCHKLATKTRVDRDPFIDPSTGAAHDSAGAILVDPAAIPPEERCGPNPASAVSSTTTGGGGGTGGAGGAGGAGTGGGGGGT